jgi:hypothetical protein
MAREFVAVLDRYNVPREVRDALPESVRVSKERRGLTASP